ncbi:PTS sugar transporter subunit IIB [uncultured Clostridium sp.]|uniref:PTS sugar transporter subunit IIB n=1 Tax=uncultured Clostridium sp. TaxID=59620 RepID=UPI0028E735CA|nr:PTS sugar transporter subunit IIB [uncultured Clostridium sp.]
MRVLFVCAAGMSSSLIADKINDKFKEKNIDGIIEAFSISELESRINKYDMVLVGPQLRYMYKKITEDCKKHNKPVAMIDVKHYGKQDANSIIKQIQKTLAEYNQ